MAFRPDQPGQRLVEFGVFIGDEVEDCHEADGGAVEGQKPDRENLAQVEVELVAGVVVY